MKKTAYIDADYYEKHSGAEASEETELLLEKASEAVDILTGCLISRKGFDNFDEFKKEHIRRAAALEAEFMEENGGALPGGFSPVQMTLGKFGYRTSYSVSEERKDSVPDGVKAHLEAAGLLYRGTSFL